MNYLEPGANIAAIATAVVAVGAYAYYRCGQRRKRLTLEQYLKGEQEASPTAKRQHTILHLIANLGMTEDELIHASFRSKHIARVTRTNRTTGLAETLLLEYRD
jgi:hypothetical protein